MRLPEFRRSAARAWRLDPRQNGCRGPHAAARRPPAHRAAHATHIAARTHYRCAMESASSSGAATAREGLTPAERAELGRARRKAVPRSRHAELELPAGRRDPVELVDRQAAARVAQLVPLRYGRGV